MLTPLEVRIANDATDLHVTRDVSGLTFENAAPGGFTTCSFRLRRDLLVKRPELQRYSTVEVSDGRTAEVLWTGLIDDVGFTAGRDGTMFQVTASGHVARAHDYRRPLIYADQSLERWEKDEQFGRAWRGWEIVGEGDSARLRATLTEGIDVGSGNASLIDITYNAIDEAGQFIGRVRFDHIEGDDYDGTATNPWQISVRGGGTNEETDNWSTTADSLRMRRGNEFTSEIGTAKIRIHTDGTNPAAIPGSNYYSEAYNIAVRCQLLDETGADVTSGYQQNYVTVEEVVKDLLGRFFTTDWDTSGATIASSATSTTIDQLAYADPVSPAEVLDDLTMFGSYYWAVWDDPDGDGFDFEFSEWPTTPRYEADVLDGFESPASGFDVYNAVTVRYRAKNGRLRSVRRTATVPELDDAGLTREAFLDLGDEVGSSQNANDVGDQFLTDHLNPRSGGTLTIGRRVLDIDGGRMREPWELRAGNLIRVRGVEADASDLTSDTNASSVFRIVRVTYNADENLTTLELDAANRRLSGRLTRRRRR